MKKAFTLIETLVAVGILAVMVSFSSVVFKAGIDSTRVADANAEIMRNLRAITNQLDSDFRGIRREVAKLPLQFATEKSDFGDGYPPDVNSDSIAFFANGDFQSTQQYLYKRPAGDRYELVAGNVAAIFYGLIDSDSYGTIPEPRYKILARRQTILTSDQYLVSAPDMLGEYFKSSLSELQADTLFDPNVLLSKPHMTPGNRADLAVYMARGVDDFRIEYSEGGLNWEHVKKPGGISPVAFKFSFRLYDSKGIIKNGRRFSYIVYVGG